MTDSLISLETLMSGWFAEKVFGPSVGAMGDQLKAYLQSRCPVIFGRAAAIAQEKGLEPGQIKPGLLARLIMDASFSDEEEEITEWWANLILDASVHGTNEHAVFSDIMAMLGPREVKCLDEFICSFPSCSGEAFRKQEGWNKTLHTHFEASVRSWMGDDNYPDRYREITNNFLCGDPSWPSRPTEWCLASRDVNGATQDAFGHDPRYTQNRLAFAVLERVGVLDPLSATISVWGGNMWVRGIGLTPIGFEFYRACKGRSI